ncbi:glucose-induced degradation protein 8-B homolog [Caerostris extrusa]|uniref:Glucose-induced degradation protein 8-B homolog n=1 Tax=Caerostris extrusa TaxID=172846 RepID=A0AAV4XZZ8_CAEEX|nr:glucose-induced degradation protein 8-B homolog [Caerostris extrusa]
MTQHIKSRSTAIEKTEDLSKMEWMEKIRGLHMQRADMNRLIMNYLVTEGFKGAAEKFRIESGIQPSVDLDSLDERIKIRDAIQNGKIQDAIDMVNSLHPELLDCNRYLFFHLQQQHLIELIRQRNIEEALKYAQEQLAERGEENREVLVELERTLALLAFDEPEKSPFGDLLHFSHRQEIASEVNASILEMENRETTTPKIATLMRVMLWIQEELEKKKIKFPRMTDIATGTIEDAK